MNNPPSLQDQIAHLIQEIQKVEHNRKVQKERIDKLEQRILLLENKLKDKK